MTYPLIVSITSMPSRLGLIRPTLESLLAGETRPDAIRLVLPEVPLRGTARFVIPDFLGDPDFCQDIVEVVRVERDWGPGTKLIGGLRTVREPSILVIADDDVRYRKDFLTGLYRAQCANLHSSFSYFTHSLGGIDVGQGVDGFSFWSPNLAGIEAFFAAYVDGTDLVFHDDLWISFFLATRGVRIGSLKQLLGGSLIYEQVHQVEALMHLEGDQGRERLEQWGLRTLMQRVPMTAARRRAIRARSLSRTTVKPLQWLHTKVRRRLDRMKGGLAVG